MLTLVGTNVPQDCKSCGAMEAIRRAVSTSKDTAKVVDEKNAAAQVCKLLRRICNPVLGLAMIEAKLEAC